MRFPTLSIRYQYVHSGVTGGLSARVNTDRQAASGTQDEHASTDHSWNPYQTNVDNLRLVSG